MNRIPSDLLTKNAARGPMPVLSQKLCVICRRALTVHQEARGRICDDRECRRRMAVEMDIQRRRNEAEALRQAVMECRDAIAPLAGVADADALRMAIIPYFQWGIAKLPRKRRAEFRAHLAGVIREALKGEFDAAAVTNLKIELMSHAQAPSSEPALAASCAVCTGFCCRNGGAHAYLDIAVVRSYMARHPGMRPGQILRAYLRQLPVATHEGSCVYHGASGCGLPRDMRSSECNEYFCEGLASLRTEIASEGPKTVFLAAAEGGKILKAAVIEPDGATTRVEHFLGEKQ
jgi:hypothetical protein